MPDQPVTPSSVLYLPDDETAREALCRRLALYTALMVTALVGWLLNRMPETVDWERIAKLYMQPLSDFQPERIERMQYILCTLTMPFACYGAYLIWNRISARWTAAAVSARLLALRLIGFIATVALAVWIVLQTDPMDVRISGNASYLWLCMALTGLMAAGLWVLSDRRPARLKGNRIRNVLPLIIGAAIVLYTGAYGMTDSVYVYPHNSGSWHYSAYFYPVYRVYAGQTIGVDFTGIYGCYAYLLAPMFRLTGALTMHGFNIVMGVLTAVAYGAIFYALYRLVKRKWLAVAGLLVTIALTLDIQWFYEMRIPYLQYMPHRMLFPALMAALCTAIVQTGRPQRARRLTAAGFALCALGVVWNLDTGLFLCMVFPLFLCYRAAAEMGLDSLRFWKRAGGFFLLGMASLAAAAISVELITLLRTGSLSYLEGLFKGPSVFVGSGFYMLPMPLVHPWLLAVLTYAVALSRSIAFLAKCPHDAADGACAPDIQKNTARFVLAVLGMALFSYYQGRSVTSVLLTCAWPAYLLIAMETDALLDALFLGGRARGFSQVSAKAVTVLTAALLMGFCLYYGMHPLRAMARPETLRNLVTQRHESTLTETVEILKQERPAGSTIDLICLHAAPIASEYGETALAPLPESIDWFQRTDITKVLDYLETSDRRVLFDTYSLGLLSDSDPVRTEAVLARFAEVRAWENESLNVSYILYAPND